MFWLNNVRIPSPTEWPGKIELIERTERTASGRMVADVVAVKRHITLMYSALTETQFSPLIDILAGTQFHTLRYPDPPGERTMTVKLTEISHDPWRIVGGVRYYRNVQIGLVER